MSVSNIQTPGQRLLATVLDNIAISSPTQKLGLIPRSDDFTTITASELSTAVNATARWIENQIGKASASQPETIAFMGANDIRYIIFVLASHKTGYKPLLPSTRLSDDAYQHLLIVLDFRKFFFTREKQRRVSEIRELRKEMDLFEVPQVEEIIAVHGSTPYPWTKEYTECEDEVALIIHSSGTTGMPKPVPLTHGFFATIDYSPYLLQGKNRQSTLFHDLGPDHLILCSTPFFHLMGFLAFTESIFHNVPSVNLPDKPLSVNLIADTVRKTKPTAAMLPPSILEDLSHTEDGIETLKSLEYVYFAGAPLATDTGNYISKYTKIITVLGSSEMGIISSFVPQGDGNWMYFEWNDAFGVTMEDAGDETYELVIPRREDSRRIHGIFHTFPEKSVYHSNDLFVRHPEHPNLWKYHGRRDDVIVLSNGEKLNPVTLEKIVEGHPMVQRAVLIGQSRFQTSLLVQPNWAVLPEEVTDEGAFINEIWPVVEKANQAVPNYGRVARNKIRLASREKPFGTTPKGTTQRHAVNRDYKEEIEAIYAAAESEQGSDVRLPATVDMDNMTAFVRQLVRSLMEREDVADDDDLYTAGLDSLQTIQLSRILKAAVSFQEPQAQSITAQHIYANPTVSRLAQFLLGILTGQTATSTSRVDRINNMVSKYTASLPQRSRRQTQRSQSGPHTVILTGSTGSLGTYLLSTLLTSPNIKKVYCFNRSDASTRQKASFDEKGLDATALDDPNRVEFLQVSFGSPQFGLLDDKYHNLLDEVTFVIHNAWAVNFNIPLESFENPHIRGMAGFITFSIESKHNAHISFVSSVSTIGAWKAEMGPIVPEVPFESPDPVMEQGYGESKHVAERLCLEAARRSAVPTTVFRVGQIAGPTTERGVWNTAEWVPTLVKTSKAIGMVPEGLGGYDVDWVPVDTLATSILELVESRHASINHPEAETEPSCAIFHTMNPCKTSWSALVPAVQEAYDIPCVPFGDWISELEGLAATNPSDDEVRQKPALKLLDFYRGLAAGQGEGSGPLSADIDTSRTCAASRTMAGLRPVGRELMLNWIRQWGF